MPNHNQKGAMVYLPRWLFSTAATLTALSGAGTGRTGSDAIDSFDAADKCRCSGDDKLSVPSPVFDHRGSK